ncbi:YybH family protein [Schauerella aestuarii]|jgi:ketosteroid isomerase-like protein|uniref:YybH family protein n=1 Tax=Schauerella aestuarii TaxID=2511204 RepID=UPI00136FE606|nr:nuclear transport factor 2 family protein [Achromobacter aestuarii]MYZ42947.1 DUF4440 domain-containing protein [Achromobacter aestuarii]
MFATPDEAEHAFYEALEQGDYVRLMQVWADDDDIVCIHPGGMRLQGHDAVQQSWRQILDAGPVHIRPMSPVVMTSMLSVTHIVIEQVTVRTRDGARLSYGYATNVFHKGPTGWRMVLHHAAPAPHTAAEFDLHDMPDMLH